MFFKELDRCVAVITGAGSGIGRAVAMTLAKEGVDLALADMNPKGLEETNELLKPSGVKVSLHTLNVSDREAMFAFADVVVAEHGQVNLLFNNAGITIIKSLEEHTDEDWERIVGVNYLAVIYGCKAFIPHLKKQPRGHIINTSSMAGFAGMPDQASYCSTKAAVQSLSESLWAELYHDNIGVTSIHPGMIKTNVVQASVAGAINKNKAEASARLVARFGMDVDKAAGAIIKAVKKNKMRQRIGVDSVLFDILKRLMPVWFHKPFTRI